VPGALTLNLAGGALHYDTQGEELDRKTHLLSAYVSPPQRLESFNDKPTNATSINSLYPQ
jgi:hypothetical protein